MMDYASSGLSTLANINRTKPEGIFESVFDTVHVDIEIKGRFGNPFVPREWFLVLFL